MLPAEEPVDPDRVTLSALHALVPAAEELDLADQARREQEVATFGFEDPEKPPSTRAPAADRDPDPAPDEDPLTEGQVRGLLEHRLGATSLPDPQGDATDADAREPDHERDD